VYSVNDGGAIEMIRRPESVDDVLVMQVWKDRESGAGRPELARKVG
jgi:hypothetical protein